ncbi:Death domain-containing adapter protein BG4, partial [Eufriesea mexicana]
MEIKYTCLKEEFLLVTQYHINENILSALKEYYAKYINSNRKLSQIKDLRTLLKILEKRDVLSYNNVDPLLYISIHFLNDLQIESKLRDYKLYLQKIQYPLSYNMYQESNENKNEKSKLSNITESSTSQIKVSNKIENQPISKYKGFKNNFSSKEAKLQQTVLSCISERIGRSWRDTVRYLGVPEYEIDMIQTKHTFNLKEQSYEALKLYMIQYSDNNWKVNLIRALEKARRRDLKELLENLILESN